MSVRELAGETCLEEPTILYNSYCAAIDVVLLSLIFPILASRLVLCDE
jgi:hypothetical protein